MISGPKKATGPGLGCVAGVAVLAIQLTIKLIAWSVVVVFGVQMRFA